MNAFGDTSTWLGIIASKTEVYVFRAVAANLNPKSPLDLLEIVRALGQAPSFQTTIDIRAIAMWQDGGDQGIDVIFTTPSGGLAFIVPSAMGFADSIVGDAGVQKVLPGLTLATPQLLVLTGPQDAITHWRSQPLLWDSSLPGPTNHGGPTDTYSSPAEYSIVLGRADDGARTKPWIVGKQMPSPPGKGSNTLLWLVGIGVVASIGYTIAKKRKRTT